MGLSPAAIRSVNYHVLYVGRQEFAEQRKVILEATRRNFLGFMRRLEIPVNAKHDKLLVILLDSEEQMQEFTRRADGGGLGGGVAGYYSPRHNWAVFFNQRKDAEVLAWEQWLSDMARDLQSIPGGPQTKVEVTTPRGRMTLSKAEIQRQMQVEWQRVMTSVESFNTVVTQHEGAHQVAFNVGVQQRGAAYPFWVSEGLACLFEVPPEKGRTAQGAALVNRDRLEAYRKLRGTPAMPSFETFVGLQANERVASADAAYSQSWALFAFTFHRHPKELSAYMKALAQRVDDADKTKYDEKAEFERYFKESTGELEKQFEKYVAGLKGS
ncbi:hypothetical protein RAS1_24160 [Phycisphaerae bacterium RAS1]|nr:hypothetical protein RAS1_24160 [Phycisphaerae bacterium RAS1]